MKSVPIETVRSALVRYFGEKAEFRRQTAEHQEAWGGPKNKSYADSLDLVAKYVAGLPDDDPTLQRLAACAQLFTEGMFGIPARNELHPSDTDNDAIHCGPRGESMDPGECEKWFRSWANTALREAADRT